MLIKWVNLFFGLLAFPNPANALPLVIVMPCYNSIMDLISLNKWNIYIYIEIFKWVYKNLDRERLQSSSKI